MTKAVIFDFDGVILESAIIKTKAFGEVVKEYPKELADAFVAYHMSHMGISRHVKFKHFIEEILNEPFSDKKEKLLSDSFEQIVFEQVMKCPFVPGAKEFLEMNHTKYDFYIASGTPDEEMKRIVKGRELDIYFKGVYGTPLKKTEIIELILSQNDYKKDEVFFVGDASTDLYAANATGLIFIGRLTDDNTSLFKDLQYKVTDLRQIGKIIEEH